MGFMSLIDGVYRNSEATWSLFVIFYRWLEESYPNIPSRDYSWVNFLWRQKAYKAQLRSQMFDHVFSQKSKK